MNLGGGYSERRYCSGVHATPTQVVLKMFYKQPTIARATAAKWVENNEIIREYEGELEQVGPAPGKPWEQHDTMVRLIRRLLTLDTHHIDLFRCLSGCARLQ